MVTRQSLENHAELGQGDLIAPSKSGNGNEEVKARLSEKVFDFVVQGISNGTLAPASRITQRELAKKLDMSHVPVREAMEKLEQHGWISRLPQRGAYVRTFNGAEISELYQIREMYEAEAVRLIGKNLTKSYLAELKGLVEAIEAACQAGAFEVYEEKDLQFHRSLMQFTGNKRLREMFESVLLQTECFMRVSALKAAYNTHRTSCELIGTANHRRIYEALAAHNVELAEQLIRKHVRVGWEGVKAMLRLEEVLVS